MRSANCVASNRWVIAASGPSLISPDLDAVRGKARLCVVNNAHRLAPWADLLYAGDHQWWMKYHAETLGFQGRIATCNHADVRLPADDRIERTPHRTGWWLTGELPFCTGQNSGHAAICLVHALYGATDIALVGYDFQHTGGMHHFFGSHEGLVNPMNFVVWERALKQLYDQCDEWGVRLVNCTRETAITCIPRMKLGDWLARSVDDPAPAALQTPCV